MEQLEITNFLTIKQANIEIGRITLVIGPQANGKSVIAKLLYFFREFLSSTYLASIQGKTNKREITKNGLMTFEKYFPKYTWNNIEFNIKYQTNEIFVRISKTRNTRNQALIKLDYSPALVSLHKKLSDQYNLKQNSQEKDPQEPRIRPRSDPYTEVLRECIYNKEIGKNFRHSIFMPAARSFFSNLQKNVFSFLATNIEIDPFIKTFGSLYENAKRMPSRRFLRGHNEMPEVAKKLDALFQEVLVGTYKYEEEKDWIENKKSRVNVANASSGQQEALPMLLILSVWPFVKFLADKYTFFIEEPEAHLFPVSQKHIISLFALIYREMGHDFFITTHSPYILTALNNLILANDISNSRGVDAVSPLVDPSFLIAYEDVKAYTLTNGHLTSIMNDDTRLIGTNIIDSVSDLFDRVFDELVSIQIT